MKILKKIRPYLIKNLKCWGCAFNDELPPEFIITPHAQKRLEDRLNCRKDKIRKMVVKAWFNKEQVKYDFKLRQEAKGYKGIYKTINGFVFIFAERWEPRIGYTQKILITVYDPKVVAGLKYE